jgi:hypothetical protein
MNEVAADLQRPDEIAGAVEASTSPMDLARSPVIYSSSLPLCPESYDSFFPASGLMDHSTLVITLGRMITISESHLKAKER